MKFVNTTNKTVHNKFTGFMHPGKIISGNSDSKCLKISLKKIIDACGDKVAIRLDDDEVALVDALMKLDAIGGKFDPKSIPDEIRNDPTGERRSSERSRQTQQKSIDDAKLSVEDARRREAFINGEILEPKRRPVGMANMEGEPVDPSKLKSGFERIMEENARIAAGEKPKADPSEMLDPVGAHMKKDGEPDAPNNDGPYDAAGKPAEPLKRAIHRPDDGTRSADAVEPLPEISERAGAMDRSAAEMARKLSIVGPDIETMVNGSTEEKPQKANKKAKGGRKTTKTIKDEE